MCASWPDTHMRWWNDTTNGCKCEIWSLRWPSALTERGMKMLMVLTSWSDTLPCLKPLLWRVDIACLFCDCWSGSKELLDYQCPKSISSIKTRLVHGSTTQRNTIRVMPTALPWTMPDQRGRDIAWWIRMGISWIWLIHKFSTPFRYCWRSEQKDASIKMLLEIWVCSQSKTACSCRRLVKSWTCLYNI